MTFFCSLLPEPPAGPLQALVLSSAAASSLQDQLLCSLSSSFRMSPGCLHHPVRPNPSPHCNQSAVEPFPSSESSGERREKGMSGLESHPDSLACTHPSNAKPMTGSPEVPCNASCTTRVCPVLRVQGPDASVLCSSTGLAATQPGVNAAVSLLSILCFAAVSPTLSTPLLSPWPGDSLLLGSSGETSAP